MEKMSAKELALLEQMQRLRYQHGTIVMALNILHGRRDEQNDMLLFLYEKHPKEEKFVERLAEIAKDDFSF